ncbi:MAG: MerC domain-containing protein [Cyclobacteriaceae bacterium]
MKNQWADWLGILSASLCIVHCLILPIVLVAGMVGKSSFPEWEWLDFIFILLAWIGVYGASRHHRGSTINRLLWANVLIFSFSLLLHEHFSWALFFSLASSLCMIVLHALHYRKLHKVAEHA